MWWVTLKACDGTKLHVPIALMLRIMEVRPDEEAPEGSKTKIVFAGGSIQYLSMTLREIFDTKAWKWTGVT